MAKKLSKKALETRRSFSLRPATLTALGVAVVTVERGGSAATRVAAIFDRSGKLVEECKFSGNTSQPIALRHGDEYQMRWRAAGAGSYRFRVVSKTSGSTLGRTKEPGVSPNAGNVRFTAA